MAQEVRPGNQSLDCYKRIPFPFVHGPSPPHSSVHSIFSLLDLHINSDLENTLPSTLGLFLAKLRQSDKGKSDPCSDEQLQFLSDKDTNKWEADLLPSMRRPWGPSLVLGKTRQIFKGEKVPELWINSELSHALQKRLCRVWGDGSGCECLLWNVRTHFSTGLVGLAAQL